jgi:hypothetical protein
MPRLKDQPQSKPDAIVELKPPPDSGFSGTAKLYAIADATIIAELLRRGYTVVLP